MKPPLELGVVPGKAKQKNSLDIQSDLIPPEKLGVLGYDFRVQIPNLTRWPWMSKGWGVPNAIVTMHDAFRLELQDKDNYKTPVLTEVTESSMNKLISFYLPHAIVKL